MVANTDQFLKPRSSHYAITLSETPEVTWIPPDGVLRRKLCVAVFVPHVAFVSTSVEGGADPLFAQ